MPKRTGNDEAAQVRDSAPEGEGAARIVPRNHRGGLDRSEHGTPAICPFKPGTKLGWDGSSGAHIHAPVVLPAPEYGLPEWLELQIKRERLALGPADSSVTDAEVVAYLMNTSLMCPLLQLHARLYLRLGRRYLALACGESIPADVLNDDEIEVLGEIKSVILRGREHPRAWTDGTATSNPLCK